MCGLPTDPIKGVEEALNELGKGSGGTAMACVIIFMPSSFPHYLLLFHVLSRRYSYTNPSMFHYKPLFFTVPVTFLATMTSQKV